jgi:hypothetical protein
MAINVAHGRVSRARTSTKAHSNLADITCYWLVSAGIYFTFGLLFYYSAKEKLIDDNGTMPAGLAKSFQGTFISSLPGTNTSWVLIGVLEALVFVAIAASVLTGEFLPSRRKPILLAGLGLSMFLRHDRLGRGPDRAVLHSRGAIPIRRRHRGADRLGAADAALPQEQLAERTAPTRTAMTI